MQRSLMLLLLIVAVTLLGGLILQSREDKKAPVVRALLKFKENSSEGTTWRLPADENFQLLLNSNEPTQFELRYGNSIETYFARRLEVNLKALAGQHRLELKASDRSGNVQLYSYSLSGLPPLQPLLRFPQNVSSGQAFSIYMALPPESYGIHTESINVTFAGQSLSNFVNNNELIALASADLEFSPGAYPLDISLKDIFDRETHLEKIINITREEQPLQQLNLSNELLSKRSRENQLFEDDVVLEAQKESVSPLVPLWRSSFLMPIEGLSSSGFGALRRYGVGGDIAFHTGTDIAAIVGTTIHATNDG
ncbi:MAG: hypothetical protein R2865_07855, partial [Deinococcales bacterium]